MAEEIAAPTSTAPYRRRVWRTVAITQLVLALLTVGGVSVAYNQLNGNIGAGEDIDHQVPKVLPADVQAAVDEGQKPTEPLNILVLGSDSRSGDGNDIDGLGDIGQRADTTILLHVSANRRNAYGVSLPRDAIIDRPDCTTKSGDVVPGGSAVMFNTAYAVGGAQCAVQTVEALTGVFIDHFLVLDFNGFKAMVDAVHGVDVCLPTEVDDTEHDIYLPAGNQTLTGQDALNYVRERYQLSVTGDIGRMKRQQSFIASMIKKVMSAGTLSQPVRVYSFLNAVTSSIQVDSKLDSIPKLVELATQFKDTGLDKIKFITVPIAAYPPDPNRLIWTDAADDLWKRIMDDQQLGKDFAETSIDASDPVGTADPSETPTTDPSAGPTDAPTLSPDEQAAADAQAEARRQAGLCA